MPHKTTLARPSGRHQYWKPTIGCAPGWKQEGQWRRGRLGCKCVRVVHANGTLASLQSEPRTTQRWSTTAARWFCYCLRLTLRITPQIAAEIWQHDGNIANSQRFAVSSDVQNHIGPGVGERSPHQSLAVLVLCRICCWCREAVASQPLVRRWRGRLAAAWVKKEYRIAAKISKTPSPEMLRLLIATPHCVPSYEHPHSLKNGPWMAMG